MSIKIEEKYVVTHPDLLGKEQVLIQSWRESSGSMGWCAWTEAITAPEDGYTADDLDNLAELFSASAQKLREVPEK